MAVPLNKEEFDSQLSDLMADIDALVVKSDSFGREDLSTCLNKIKEIMKTEDGAQIDNMCNVLCNCDS